MFRWLNPFYFITHRLEIIMSLAQDTKTAADAATAAIAALDTKVEALLTANATVTQQLADLINSGGMSDADRAALQSSVDTLTSATMAANTESGKIDAALAPAPAPAPAASPDLALAAGVGNPPL